jgi:putative two-component system response regulator
MSLAPAVVGTLDSLRALEARAGGLERAELRSEIAAHARRLDGPAESAASIDAALAVCRTLYEQARSGEALPLARAALARARAIDEPLLVRRAATACGVLSADSLDLVGAIEYHVFALRMANLAGDDLEASRAWNCIGLAMGISGHYELAARCYRRCLELVEAYKGPIPSRGAALLNLSHALYCVGSIDEGLACALRALEEEKRASALERDRHAPVFLRRNLTWLLAACGRGAEAERYVEEAVQFAQRVATPRAEIAMETARATYEAAIGRTDVALTRLERTLARAREVPATLHNTLMCAIRADEAAGNIERAVARLRELSDHVYRFAIDCGRQHVELATMAGSFGPHQEGAQLHVRARLVTRMPAPAVPDAWPVLERLAANAALHMEPSGLHGKRVGTLVKRLALAAGCEPLQALEMGLAAELHDIGMLSVPFATLRKEGSLNDLEYALVQRHVSAGAEMLCDDRDARVLTARDIAHYHHARWDGDGYPERIGGKRIPFAARACAVADAYDAIVCGIGGEAWSMEAAMAEIRAAAGTQFDPHLVECFERMIRSETEELGMDFAAEPGMEEFQALVSALQEDRGFI